MAAQDRNPNDRADSSGGPFDEDEDLFDFPIIEMTLEGLQERATAGSEVHTLPADPGPPPALPKQSPVPAQASTLSSTPPPAPVQEPRPKPVTVSAPLSAIPPEEKPVEEDVPSVSFPRRARQVGVRVALALLIVMNAGGFWFLWRTHTRFGSGLDELRAEIDTASKRLERARRDVNDRTPGGGIDSVSGLDAIDALERTAIQLATDEIRVGEYGAARRRLSRLLARAEHMSPGLRAEVEPKAAYLIAQSYHDEARARTSSLPAPNAPAGDAQVPVKDVRGTTGEAPQSPAGNGTAPAGDKH